MSQIHNVVTTEFRAYDGQLVATMGSIGQKFGQMGQQINQATRMSERFGQQWRAIGTTIRYALAGTAVFGLKGVVDQLKEIQQQAGLISAIGTTQSGGAIVGKNLNNLMAQARMGAVESITPLQDFNNSIINILSTVQNVPENKIVPIAVEIAKAAKLSQINAEDATKAFTTMNVAFNRPVNLSNIHRMAQEFFLLTKEAPGGAAAGQQIITQLGQLSAVTKAGHGTPEDVFSLLLSGLRGGIPPAQLGRGMQYLIQTISLPGQQSKASEAAMRSVGIIPGADMNVQERLSRIMSKARQLGVKGNTGGLAKMDEETLADFEALGPTGSAAAGLKGFGISGKGAEFLGAVFPRIHALRAAFAIQTQIDAGKAQTDLKMIQDARDGHVRDLDNIAKAWDRFSERARLQAATIAIQAMGQQVATIFEPVFNFAANQTVGASRFLAHHAHGTSNAVWGGVAAGGSLAALRFLGIKPMQALRGLTRGVTGATAITAAATGGGDDNVMKGLGNNPLRPLFVYVVNSIYKMPGLPGGAGNEGRVAKQIKDKAPWLAPFGYAVKDRFFGAARSARNLAAAGFLAAEAPAVPDALRMLPGLGEKDPITGEPLHFSWSRFFTLRGQKTERQFRMSKAEDIRNKFNPHDPSHITQLFRTAVQNINGKAYVTLDVNLQHPGGKVERKKIHIPMDLWGKTGQAPSVKGNQRSGNRSR